MKAMAGPEQQISRSSHERPLGQLVRLRASRINGCAYCIDTHAADARNAGESERRLATVAVWRERPFVSDREGAALEWTESVTRAAETHVTVTFRLSAPPSRASRSPASGSRQRCTSNTAWSGCGRDAESSLERSGEGGMMARRSSGRSLAYACGFAPLYHSQPARPKGGSRCR